MKALVATNTQLLYVDLATAHVKIVESHRANYYGISWWQYSEHPVLIHSGVHGPSLKTFADFAHSEQGYVSCGEKESQKFLSCPHQIVCATNGWLVIANTGRNRVTIYDPSTEFFRDIRVTDCIWDRTESDNLCGEHLNSVHIKDDRLYVMAHGFHKKAYVLEYSYPDCKLIKKHDIKYLTGLHNIWVDHTGNMISCHSASGQLIELKTNEVLWSGHASHVHGLAVTSDLIVIGDSEHAQRMDRTKTQCGLWLIDRTSLKTIDYIPLGVRGECHEVRILDIPDEAHHGIPFANIHAIEQLAKLSTENDNAPQLTLRRTEKLNSLRSQATADFASRMHLVIGAIESHENGWMTAQTENRYQSRLLAVSRQTPAGDFNISTDYRFQKNENFPEQNFSVIIGYRGSHDSNMLAVFLHFTKVEGCHLYLMKNENHTWGAADLLLPEIPRQGKISLRKAGNKLFVSCSDLEVVERILPAAEFEGAIGVRCHGAFFRNFTFNLSGQQSAASGHDKYPAAQEQS